MSQYCNNYGDRTGCLGVPDERYIMRFDEIGEPPLLWCAFCGPDAVALAGLINDALATRGEEFQKEFQDAIESAVQSEPRQ